MPRSRARLGSAALEELRLQRIEERYTLGVTLRALMQAMNVRMINISANIHQHCRLFDWTATLMKHPAAVEADSMTAAALLPSV